MMIKKIGLFLLLLFAIFGFGVSFADVISPNTHRVDRCIKISNPHGIPGYKLIVRRDEFYHGIKSYSVYSVEKNKCLPHFCRGGSCRSSDFPYLIDENIDISTLDNLPSEEFENKIGKFYKLDEIDPNGRRVDNSNPLSKEIFTYKIIKTGNNYVLEESDSKSKNNYKSEDDYSLEIFGSSQGKNLASVYKLKKFGIAWIITILIETMILFLIAKFCRKSWSLKNRKIFVTGILASTVTLPLLWFVLPIFFTNYWVYVIFGETLVTVIETFIIKYSLKVERKMAIFASVICNLCSFLVGRLIMPFLEYFLLYSSLSMSSRIYLEREISSIILKIRNSGIYTIIFEPIILFIVLRLLRNKGETSKKRIFLIGFLASLLTLPLLWFILPYFIADKSEYIVFGIIVIIESFIIKYGLKIGRGKAIILSIICNLLSYSIREFLTYLS